MKNYRVDWNSAFSSLIVMLLLFTLLNSFLLITKTLYNADVASVCVTVMLVVSFIINIRSKTPKRV